MSPQQPTEKELLKRILEPLLEDFQYWFNRSRSLLETEELGFISPEEQAKLLKKVIDTQQEVRTVQMLFQATDGEAGIPARMLVPWHNLVAECWQIARRWRISKNENYSS